MPRFDGTGPFGTGPVGRGLGPCGQGRQNRNFLSTIGSWFGRFGIGFGRGRGWGRGRGGGRGMGMGRGGGRRWWFMNWFGGESNQNVSSK